MRLIPVIAPLFLASAAFASFSPSNLDPSVKPQDDFYLYADGGWIKNNPIPADRSRWGGFDELHDRNEAILHAILKDAEDAKDPGFITKLVGDFYFSGMDSVTVDAAGALPLKAELDAIDAVKSPADLAGEVARLHAIAIPACFALGSEQDPKNSAMMITGQGQGGLGMPDRDYYLRDDDGSKKLREGYVAHVARMFQLLGDSEAQAASESQAVMKLETQLAKGSKSDVDLRDPIANYHFMALADVEKLSPHFDWPGYLGGIGLVAPASMDVGQPEFLQTLDAQLAATPVDDWKAYFRWQLVHGCAPYLSQPFVDENFAFFGKTLTGTPKLRDRWKRVLATVDADAGEALGQLYVAKAFPPESKARMLALVGNIRTALHDRIEKLEWMDEPTRAAALKKLSMFGVKIGYPDKWIDYSTLSIDRGPYVLNVLRANAFNVKRDLAKIGKPVDRTEWGMTPPTVNAYYNPSMNEIVFPAGILQPPFFDAKADDAVNYGGIGMVIGHEMTHGFDDQGRQYDGSGNLSDWWTPESARRFKLRSEGIVKQFDGYVAIDSLHVNGALTQGENIADLGGLKLSYTALMSTLAGKPVERIDGFTPQQRFFLSFADVWHQNQRPQALRLQVNTNPHSPARFRVDGPLSNLDEFAAAFDVPEGAPMRRAAAERVTIW
jgi:predicted metalloendopeptidase